MENHTCSTEDCIGGFQQEKRQDFCIESQPDDDSPCVMWDCQALGQRLSGEGQGKGEVTVTSGDQYSYLEHHLVF